MLWIIISVFAVASLSSWLGYKHLLYLDLLTFRKLSFTIIAVFAVFIFLEWMHLIGYFPEAVAGAVMANVYASLFGFFAGAAVQQYHQKTEAGIILYVNRSFWTDIFPNFVTIALIVFGIYRTSLFSEWPFTPIRVTSGLSIMAVGFYNFTIRLVPELRKEALILLDRKIDWDDFLTYSWFADGVIEMEYKLNGQIKSFKTMVPNEDQIEIEKILTRKIAEKMDKEEYEEYEELE